MRLARHLVGRARQRADPAHGRHRAGLGQGQLVRRQHCACGRHERVATPRHRGRAGVIRDAAQRAAPALPRGQRGRDGQGRGHVDQIAPLLDVHLDPGGHARQECGRRAQARGRHAAQGGQIAAARCPPGSVRDEDLVDVELAAERARAEDRGAEARALLVDHRADGQRPDGATRAPGGLDRHEPRHDAERAVVRAAVGHRVEMRADGVERAVRAARLDRPEVGGRVLHDLQPERAGRGAEPLASGVLPRPPGHPVPAARPAPDLGELGEEAPVEAGVDHTISASSLAPVSWTGPSSPRK